ncbi:MAG: cytochrome P450 [Acidimicrobiales bacterium]|jgi:cytochrome P450|nr:cytochrome P450 [Acidimicrobiales bacterium]|tara:strand:+ start:10728 stop:11987 length:1260 start_codon:yes stop_codon:yes gene_type:complete
MVDAMELGGIDLSDMEGFWTRPMVEREAAFATLRREDPIRFFEERDLEILPAGPGYWAVTRHADVIEASRHADLFCSGRGTNIPDLPPEFNEFFGSMISMDDPRHARMRRIVSAGFTPKMMRRLEVHVEETAESIVDSVAGRGECDFVGDIAARLPLVIICEMMGIDPGRYDEVFRLSNVILSQGDPEFFSEGDDPLEAFLAAGASLAAIMNETAESRRGGDGEDLTTILVNAEVEGERLTAAELASFFVLLCVAGNETTRNAITWGLEFLTANPDQMELWLSDIDGITPTAVDEIVRMSSPVIHFRRTVTTDGARLGGREFSAGDKVVLWYNSANRDEAVFDDPDRFDVTRDPNHHVGFGGPGPHFCMGSHLARREVSVLYRHLLRRLPDIHATAPPDRLRGNFVNGVKRLPCAFTPA